MSAFAEIYAQIQPGLPTQQIDLGDNSVTLTVTEAAALIAAGVRFGEDDAVTIKDSAANLEGLSATGIDAIAKLGGSALVATDRGLDLTLAQIEALADADITAVSRYETVRATSPDDATANTSISGNQQRQAVAEFAGGGYLVVWQSSLNGEGNNGIYAQRFDANGDKIGGETRISADAGGSFATVMQLTDGGYVIVWQGTGSSQTDIYARKFDAAGNPVGGQVQVNTETAGVQTWSNVTALGDGKYAVTWLNKADGTVRAQIFGADGQAIGTEITAGTDFEENGTQPPGITLLSNGGFVIVWPVRDDDGAFIAQAQLFDADGSKLGAPFPVNSPLSLQQLNAKVSALPGGGFVVTWMSFFEDESQIVYSQLFDGAGNRIGVETQVTTADVAQASHTVNALVDGGYVITWLAGDGSSTGVYSQVFDATGTKIGTETRVNTTVVGEQRHQVVTALKGGGFAVTWLSQNANGAGTFVQIMDAQGQKIGAETLVSEGGRGLEGDLRINVLTNGNIVISWRASDGDGYGVFTKLLTHDTEKVSFKADADVVSAMTGTDVADFAKLGVNTVKVADGHAVVLTKDIALSLADLASLKITGASSVTVTSTGAELSALTVNEIAALKALGVEALDASDQAVTLTFSRAEAIIAAGIAFAAGDSVAVTLSAGDLADLTAGKITALAQMRADILDLSGNAASLTIARAGLLMEAGLRFAAGDVITIADTAAHVSGLAPTEIAALGRWGISIIDLTDGTLTLAASAASHVLAAGLRFAANDTILVEDSVATIEGLDAAEIAAFAAGGIDGVRSLGGDVALSTAQLIAFGANRVSVAASGGGVKVVDTAAHIAALGITAIGYFQTLGIVSLDVSDNQVTLSLTQLNALRSAGVDFASNDVITLMLTGSQTASLTTSAIGAFAELGVTSLASSETSLSFTAAQVSAIHANGLSFAAGYAATLADKANTLLALTEDMLADYSGIGLDKLKLADTGSAIAGLTVVTITALSRLGVDAIDVIDGAVSLTMARAMSFAANGLVFDAADTVIVTATAASLKDPDITDIPALKSINIDKIDVSDNVLLLSLARADAYVGAGIGFVSADVVTVRLSYAQAKALAKATGDALHAAGIDRVEIEMTAQQLKALTYTELKALVAAGVDGILGVTKINFGDLTYDLVTHTANYNPVISSNGGGAEATIAIAENTPAVTTVRASDRDAGSTLTYSIVGGANKALFSIDARTGALRFKTAPDFESPKDSGKNNVYDLIVQASDGRLIDLQTMQVTVKNVNEAPLSPVLSGATVKENARAGTLVGTFSSKDPEGKALTYKLLDSAGGLFKLSGSKLVTVKAIDYEKVQKDTVTISVSDGVHTVKKTFTISVGDLTETINGTAKADVLTGGIGMDKIVGGAGNDRLTGGLGFDHLHGGSGSDRFVFRSAAEMGTSTTATDTIFDFSQKEKDVIDLVAIDANLRKGSDQAFSFIGTSKFSKTAGELRYEKTKADTYVYGDMNGDGKADLVLHIDAAINLKGGDFLL